MIPVEEACRALRDAGMTDWATSLPSALEAGRSRAHGRLEEWRRVIERLPALQPDAVRLDTPAVTVGDHHTLSPDVRDLMETGLRALHPWRKGPFALHGLRIDTEWRSDLKWQRLVPHIASLEGRMVLDVGAGNGYYGWRMIGEGARLVIGIDPTWLFLAQFEAIRHFIGSGYPLFLLPLGIESVPPNLECFDTVFSMGVLYHRRSPLDHLLELRGALRPGGELVIESLVVDGGANSVLLPGERYAKMRNVWFIPSVVALEGWLRRCGFESVRTVDVTPTTGDEQRRTDWMTFESLADFLDPDDPRCTIEGYPAPVRAVAVARRPGK
jgi:tRNA (mo5U34)-methyltransferase